MNRSILGATAATLAALLAVTPAMAAENFTFTSTVKAGDGVRVPPTGPAFQGGRVFSIATETSYADRKETTASKCASWTNAPGSAFPQSGVCSVADLYTVRFSCAPASDKPTEANCWGLLEGVGGRFKGRTGVIAYRNSTGSIGVRTWN